MKKSLQKLLEKRRRILEELAALPLLVHGSYLERFSTCARKQCACHQGRKHGPRAYLVVYRDKKQRQAYVPQAQQEAIKQGIRQHQRLMAIVQQITDINLKLMRAGVLDESCPATPRGGKRHE